VAPVRLGRPVSRRIARSGSAALWAIDMWTMDSGLIATAVRRLGRGRPHRHFRALRFTRRRHRLSGSLVSEVAVRTRVAIAIENPRGLAEREQRAPVVWSGNYNVVPTNLTDPTALRRPPFSKVSPRTTAVKL
jgi:hypothetical protein